MIDSEWGKRMWSKLPEIKFNWIKAKFARSPKSPKTISMHVLLIIHKSMYHKVTWYLLVQHWDKNPQWKSLKASHHLIVVSDLIGSGSKKNLGSQSYNKLIFGLIQNCFTRQWQKRQVSHFDQVWLQKEFLKTGANQYPDVPIDSEWGNKMSKRLKHGYDKILAKFERSPKYESMHVLIIHEYVYHKVT